MKRLVVGVSAALVLLLVAVLTLVVVLVTGGSGAADRNPFADALPAVDPDAAAAGAAAQASANDRALLQRLAAVPTAVWLLPEALDAEQVAERTRQVVTRAADQGRVPLLVVYGIPARDCAAGESAGGLPDADAYERWVEAVASEAEGAAVVLEPDALATADECGITDDRVALLRGAAQTLDDAGAWAYVDAGHSDWVAASRMAELVQAVGPEHLRGFATNVAAYGTDDAEQAYAEAVVAALDDPLHYVIDTGRNGNGPAAPGEFCNPQGRALGREPAAGSTGALDAWLWIKPPGESDGACNGGPAAGKFWVAGALDLATAAGWA